MKNRLTSLEELFWQAKQLTPGEQRSTFLRDLRNRDAALAEQLHELLKGSEKADLVFDQLSFHRIQQTKASSHDQNSGCRNWSDSDGIKGIGIRDEVGPYKLLELIGEGGMGLVYLAQQSQPVRRKVALKIIKPGMDSLQVVARFEAERQALAIMDHQNIAKVLDAGATENGLPFFVMELVRGIPITDYCDRTKIPNHRRLELFCRVCEAIQHAHNKGVIHRDIKPSNVLVTEQDGRPLVKVIDFGIAKALGDNLTDKTMFTGMFQMIGTPLYMSPEQASLSNVDVDVRSDVYSLGVMLYELVCGALPIDREEARELNFDQLRKRICETEPPRPSQRISTLKDCQETIAERRGINAHLAPRMVSNELDWIVMKAIDKDRNRRYQSARDLSADIHRLLNDEAVEACPPSAVYKLQKFYRKNRMPVIAASIVFLTLCIATAFSLWQTSKANAAKLVAESNEKAAQEKADESSAILEFLIADVLKSAKPAKSLGREMTVAEMLKEADAKVRRSFEDRPLVRASIQEAIASTFDSLDNWQAAEFHSADALAIRQKLLGDNHRDTIQSMITHARVLDGLRRVSEARNLFKEAYESATRTLGRSDILTFQAMFGAPTCDFRESKYESALEQLDRILAVDANPLTKSNTPYKNSIRNAKTIALKALGRYDEALKIQEALCRDSAKIVSNDHPELMRYKLVLAGIYEYQSKPEQAKQIYTELIESRIRVYGPKARKTLLAKRRLADLKLETKDYKGARKDLEALLPPYLEVIGKKDHETALLYLFTGRACSQLDDFIAAEEYLTTALDICSETIGSNHRNTLLIKTDLATVVERQGETERALEIIDDVIVQSAESRSNNDYATLNAKANKAAILFNAERYREAAVLHREVYDQRVKLKGRTHPETISSASMLRKCLQKRGQE